MGPLPSIAAGKAKNAPAITYVYIMFRRLVDMSWWPSNNAYIQVCKMMSGLAMQSDTSSALFLLPDNLFPVPHILPNVFFLLNFCYNATVWKLGNTSSSTNVFLTTSTINLSTFPTFLKT